MRKNARAIALPDFIGPEVTESTVSVLPGDIATVENPASPKVVQAVAAASSASTPKVEYCEACPPPEKKKRTGVLFRGSINQLIVMNSIDAVKSFCA